MSEKEEDSAPEPARGEEAPARRAARAVRRGNREPAFIRMFRSAREILPGDASLGTGAGAVDGGAADRVTDVIVRFLGEKPQGTTVSREAGLAAVQVWQALAERTPGGGREVEATILFTDLAGFSDWVLEAGDEAGLELLRAVAGVVGRVVKRHRGRIVKHLGDGHMAVFPEVRPGVDAALEIGAQLEEMEVRGHRPRLRAGLHVGTPQKVGHDFLGTAVNVAARVGAAARPGELLVSGDVLREIDADGLEIQRRYGFRAKGVPSDLRVFVVRRVTQG